jgi:hypothetical protein
VKRIGVHEYGENWETDARSKPVAVLNLLMWKLFELETGAD